MIHLDGEVLTIAAFARRCVQRKMSNAQARAALGDAEIDPHTLDVALSDARRVARGGELLRTKGWTDERVARLRELWGEGLSASQIAAEIGGEITRCAVIGKVHRLGIEVRAKVAARPAQRVVKPKAAAPRKFDPRKPVADRAAPYVAPVAEIVAVSPSTPAPEEMEPSAMRVRLTELRERMCKWPIGDPGSPEFGFCGAKAALGAVYCGYHAQIAYQPSQRRGRKDGSWNPKGTGGHATARRLSCSESYRW
jgi:GcrA cell cycle regulator